MAKTIGQGREAETWEMMHDDMVTMSTNQRQQAIYNNKNIWWR